MNSFLQQKNIDVVIVLAAVSIIIMLPQIYEHAIIVSGDSLFHLNRFYETYKQIKTGNYSYFQTLYGFNGSARIVNALYGPYLAYLMGFFLLILKSWFKFQLVTGFLLLFISGYSMYFLARKISIKKAIAVGLAIMYMCTPWVASESFTAVGAALFPLVFVAGASMVNVPKPVSILKLSLLMSVLIEVHVFTSVLAVVVLIPFFVVGMIKNENKGKLLLHTILSALITFCLTSNVWIALVEVMGSNKVLTVFPSEMTRSTMGFSDVQFSLLSYGIIYSVVFMFVLVRTIVMWRKIGFFEKLIDLIGIFFLLISTGLFPWRVVEHRFVFLRTFVQFPQRFSVVAFVAIILGLGIFLNDYPALKSIQLKNIGKIFYLVLLSLLIINANSMFKVVTQSWNTSSPYAATTLPLTKDANKIRESFKNSNNLGEPFEYLAKVNPDYLPTQKNFTGTVDAYSKLNPYNLYYQQISLNKVKLKHRVERKGTIEVSWINSGLDSRFMQLPLVEYAHSSIYINGHKATKRNSKVSKIGVISVYSDVGKNTLTIEYIPSQTTRKILIANWICWMFFLLVIGLSFLRKKLFLDRID
ncbi:hypothetical protein IV59_GL000518 [Paucilactobacillus hokkaidonensis]|nr:hypothetical protein IV59_GL000518 [Paucilactobacillus hokkaidonensis]